MAPVQRVPPPRQFHRRVAETLKRRISDPDVPRRKMKEFIIRLIYIEMLGHDASFGYIHAIKMTYDDTLLLKRTGYLTVTLFLNEDHNLITLIVKTIQKNLRPVNYLVVCAALTVVCKLINEETITAFSDTDCSDPHFITAISSFSILLAIHSMVLPPLKVKDAALSLADFLKEPECASLDTWTVRSLIKSLGMLLILVDMEDWSALELPLQTLIVYAVDKRPKV